MKKDRQEWKDNLQKGGRLWCRNQRNYLSDRIEISERVPVSVNVAQVMRWYI